MAKNIKVFDNIKKYIGDKTSACKLVLVTLSVAVGLSLSGCDINKDSYKELNRNMIITEETSIADRKEYYKNNVDDIVDNMTEQEKDDYYVKISVEYVGSEVYKGDDLVFLRNDNVYKGDIKNTEDDLELTPGIYKVISEDVIENNGDLGEIELLTPGEEVTLTINYDEKTATVKEKGKTK